ncbi:MAG: hypothetical protein Kow0027_10410 [Saprospiraceae bacterium]
MKDKGPCRCTEGFLSVDWKLLFGRKIDYEIFFKDESSVELRYFDYKKDLAYYLSGDSSVLHGKRDNPAKIVG